MTMHGVGDSHGDDKDGPLLFLHIPKTGGSTLSKYLYQHPAFLAEAQNIAQPDSKYFNYGIYHYPAGFWKDPPCFVAEQRKHIQALSGLQAVVGHFSFGIHSSTHRQHRYVTLLRHPIDRILSLYSHVRLGALREWVDLRTFASECPAEGWVPDKAWKQDLLRGLHCAMDSDEFIGEISRTIVDNDQVRRIAGDEPRFGGCTTATLERAKANLRDHFMLVGTTERFLESLVLLSQQLRPRESPRFLPQLVNTSRPSRGDLPKAVHDAITARNSLDLELYRFADRLLNERIAAAGPSFADDLELARATNEQHLRDNQTVLDSIALTTRPAVS